jgi:hypothetical protein
MQSLTKCLPWSRVVRDQAKVLLCITTLGHRRFVDDAIQMIGLPRGARILLRYRKRYTSSEVWNLARDSGLNEAHVLLVLGAEIGGSSQYRPLRVARICSASADGEILSLDVCLDGYAAEGNYVWTAVREVSKQLPASLAAGASAGGHYVQLLISCPGSVLVDQSVEGWERAADALFSIDPSARVPFLYAMRSQSSQFGRLAASGELVVEGGAKLGWDIHTKCNPKFDQFVNPLGEVLVELSCPAMRMITSRRIRVDSRRDVKFMQLACDASFRPVPGHLSIRVVTFQADNVAPIAAADRKPLTLSRHDIPVRVGWILPVASSIAAAGAATSAMWKGQDWSSSNNIAAILSGVLVFLSLSFGLRGKS